MGDRRFTIIRMGYRFDKYLFRSLIIILLITVGAIWFIRGGGDPRTEHIHLVCECDQPRPCSNPIYKSYEYRGWPGISEELLETENLFPCFEINRPPWYITYFGEITALIILAGFIINHLLYNRGFDFKKFFKEVKEEMDMESENEKTEVLAYCVRCKKKQNIKEFELKDVKTTRGVKRFAIGVCPVCRTKVWVTVSAKNKR